jgi:hypothetical protein
MTSVIVQQQQYLIDDSRVRDFAVKRATAAMSSNDTIVQLLLVMMTEGESERVMRNSRVFVDRRWKISQKVNSTTSINVSALFNKNSLIRKLINLHSRKELNIYEVYSRNHFKVSFHRHRPHLAKFLCCNLFLIDQRIPYKHNKIGEHTDCVCQQWECASRVK